MTTPKHTPTPWKFADRLSGSENHHGFYLYSEIDRHPLADVMPLDQDGIKGSANAALIVRAVNAFEPMREALRVAYEVIRSLTVENEVEFEAVNSTCTHIRAALALADKP